MIGKKKNLSLSAMENLQSKVGGGGTPTKSFQIAHLKKKKIN